MYKIMILIRDSITSPLWTPLFVTETILVDDPNGKPDEDGNIPQIEVTQTVEYNTDDVAELEKKIIEMLDTYTRKSIKVIQDVTYTIDLLIV